MTNAAEPTRAERLKAQIESTPMGRATGAMVQGHQIVSVSGARPHTGIEKALFNAGNTFAIYARDYGSTVARLRDELIEVKHLLQLDAEREAELQGDLARAEERNGDLNNEMSTLRSNLADAQAALENEDDALLGKAPDTDVMLEMQSRLYKKGAHKTKHDDDLLEAIVGWLNR